MHRFTHLALSAALLLGLAACGSSDEPGSSDSRDGGESRVRDDAGSSSTSDGGSTGGRDGGDPPTRGIDAGTVANDAGPPPPECAYEDELVCDGDPEQWCGSGSCVACAENKFNCDGTRGCECEDGCMGSSCLPENACTGEVAFECDSDGRWCYTRHPSGSPQCQSCSDGFLNCDGLAGCEFSCSSFGPLRVPGELMAVQATQR